MVASDIGADRVFLMVASVIAADGVLRMVASVVLVVLAYHMRACVNRS